MRLIHALRNIDALKMGVAPRNWGADTAECLCGCVYGKPCTRLLVIFPKVVKSRSAPESEWLAEMLADLELAVAALDEMPRAIFSLLYWDRAAKADVASWLGFRSPSEFERVHDAAYALIAARLGGPDGWFSPDPVKAEAA